MPNLASLSNQAPDGEVPSDLYAYDPTPNNNDNLQPQAPGSNPEEVGRDAIPCHPLGVKPSGNALLASWNLRPAIGTFQILPDELIVIVLEWFDGASLLNIGRTCKAFYAFTRAEELWKGLFVEYVLC